MKNKKIFALPMILICFLLFGLTSKAETLSGGDDWRVEFTSEKEMKSNFTTGNFDDVLDNMQPGDSATFSVEVKNTYNTATDWYMTNKVIQSLEDASKTAKGGGYSYLLTYTNASGNKVTLFSSDEVGGESYIESLEGLHEATDSLKDYFYLDRIESGNKGQINLYVLLDGETQGNDYQDTLAQLQMNFAVELPTLTSPDNKEDSGSKVEYRKQPDKVVVIQQEDKIVQGNDIIKIVHTGDDTNIILLIIAAFILSVLLLILAILGIKLRKEIKNSNKSKGLRTVFIIILTAMIFMEKINVNAGTYFDSDYTYTVRIFSGAQGTFSGGREVITIQASPNTVIDLSKELNNIQMNPVMDLNGEYKDSKYYAKGIRESGKDNNTVTKQVGPVFRVTQDIDYVVAYGMNIGDTTYTVKYVDKNTQNEIAPSESFAGNIGEKTVVAYKYIDGYIPEAYNLAKTLVEDASKNVLTFEYTKKTGSSSEGSNSYSDGGIKYIDLEGETIYEYREGNVIYINGEERVVIIHDGNNDRNNNHNNQNNNEANSESESDNNSDSDLNSPVDMIDLDETDTPLTDAIDVIESIPTVIDVLQGSDAGIMLTPIITAILLFIAVIVLIVLLFYFFSKKVNKANKKNEKED